MTLKTGVMAAEESPVHRFNLIHYNLHSNGKTVILYCSNIL